MDDDVCLECGAATSPLSAHLELPSGAVDRRWWECSACGWESPYQDVLRRGTSDAGDQTYGAGDETYRAAAETSGGSGGTAGLPSSGAAPRRASW